MRSPTLGDLPSSPEGKTGWPWTEETPQLPDVMPDGSPWPKISIVTPNYNYGRFIEETIRSILLQGYPNLEYIIIDDGSTDNSIEIIKNYEKWLTYWTTQSNRGQVDAINKGLSIISGQICNWIDSDNLLLPDALLEVASLYSEYPHSIICGACILFDENAEYTIKPNSNLTVQSFVAPWSQKFFYCTPAVWVPADFITNVGLLDNSYDYHFDWEWMVRLLRIYSVRYTHKVMAMYRLHPSSKTCQYSRKFSKELRIICEKYIREFSWQHLWRESERFFAMVNWYNDIKSIRESNLGRLRKACLILINALRSFDRLKSRFTWGALRQTLFSTIKN